MYNIHTRSCAVKIFKSLLKAINDHIETKEEKAKLLDPVLPIFIDKLIGSLNVSTGYELKTEIIKGRAATGGDGGFGKLLID